MKILNSMFGLIVFIIITSSSNALAGALIDVNGVKAYLPTNSSDQPNSSQLAEIKMAAIAYQTNGGTYKADNFSVALLPAGTKIYGMIPYQSAFYTDQATVERAKDWAELYKLLQIKLPTEYEPRKGFATYKTTLDMWIAVGNCYNNQQFGIGGGYQYVMPIFIKQQELYSDETMFIKSWSSRRLLKEKQTA